MLLTIISFIVVLGVLVFFHELGHYWVARRNGIVVEEFGMGYPPRLVKLFTYDGTLFTLNLIPFGGFARMKGEDASDMSAGSFNSASRRARAATLLAGPAMNAILAVVLFAASFMAGFPAIVGSPLVTVVAPGSVAASIGVESDDVLLKLGSRPVQVGAISDFQYDVIQDDFGDSSVATTLTVSRGGDVVALPLLADITMQDLMDGITYTPVLMTQLTLIAEGSPAEESGLLAGDLVYSVNASAITLEFSLSEAIQQHVGEEVSMTVFRGEEWVTVSVTPRVNPPEGEGALGVQIGPLNTLATLPPLEAVWQGIRSTGEYIVLVLKLPAMLMMGQVSPGDAQLTGPVGIAQMVGGAVSATLNTGLWFPIWRLSAVLSAALAITNMLPLPALDGGRLLFIFFEALRGRRVNPEREGMIHMVGFVLLLGLLALITVRDITTTQQGIDWLTLLGNRGCVLVDIGKTSVMTDQSANLPDPSNVTARSAPDSAGPGPQYATVSAYRSVGTRKCPSCDARTPAYSSVCPECGDALQTNPKKIRCRRCGNSAMSELVICPHCGRELQPAPPRLFTWGGPIVVVGLFFLLLVSRWDGGNPSAWAQLTLTKGFAWADDFDGGTEPDAITIMTPVIGNRQLVAVVGETEQQEGGAQVAPDLLAVVDDDEHRGGDQPINMAVLAPTATGAFSPTSVPTEAFSEALSIAVSSPTPDEPPTVAPTPTPNAVPSLGKIVPAVKALSQDLPTATPADVMRPTAAPSATASYTPSPSSTPTSTPTQTDVAVSSASAPARQTYQIRTGDTLLGIASRYGVDVETLMQVNDIEPNEANTIQPGQTIVIPVPGEVVESTPTPTATATLTPTPVLPPKPIATPTAIESVIRLDAPVLGSPENGTPVSCSAPTSLVWVAVPYIKAEDIYVLHLGFVSGRREDNQDIVTWVLAQPRPSNVTSWDMDENLCGLAPQEFGRQWRWWVDIVEAVDGDFAPVSPPSQIWGFSWN